MDYIGDHFGPNFNNARSHLIEYLPRMAQNLYNKSRHISRQSFKSGNFVGLQEKK